MPKKLITIEKKNNFIMLANFNKQGSTVGEGINGV
jgi:hypothetical protein